MNKAPTQVTQFAGGILRFDDGTVSKLDASGNVPQARVPASQINLLKQPNVTADELAAKNEADALAAQKAEEAAAEAKAQADAEAVAAAKANPGKPASTDAK